MNVIYRLVIQVMFTNLTHYQYEKLEAYSLWLNIQVRRLIVLLNIQPEALREMLLNLATVFMLGSS